MTLSTTENRKSFAGDDVTLAFAYPFFFLKNEDLLVVLQNAAGVETTQVLDTDYSVVGAGLQAGGTVTMVVEPAVDETLIIVRDPEQTQDLDLVENDDQPAESVEQAHDKAMMVIQRLQDLMDRAAVLNETDPEAAMKIPLLATRLSKFLGFDGAGDMTALASPTDTALTTAFTETFLDDANAPDARTTLGFDGGAGLVSKENVQAGLWLQPGMMFNIGFGAVTGDDANDTLRAFSADGTALSAANPGFVVLPAITPGQLTIFKLIANVDRLLTDADFGARADLTDQKLVINWLNNNGSLVLGIGTLSQVTLIDNADDSITPSDITSPEKVLVTTALTAAAQAIMAGWFNADYDLTGGASERLWTIQTGDDDINVGFRDLPISAGYGRSSAQTFTTGVAATFDFNVKQHDTHNAVTTGASWVFTALIPGHYSISSKISWAQASFTALNSTILNIITTPTTFTDTQTVVATATQSPTQSVPVSSVFLAKGETISGQASQNAGADRSTVTTATRNYIGIAYVGP